MFDGFHHQRLPVADREDIFEGDIELEEKGLSLFLTMYSGRIPRVRIAHEDYHVLPSRDEFEEYIKANHCNVWVHWDDRVSYFDASFDCKLKMLYVRILTHADYQRFIDGDQPVSSSEYASKSSSDSDCSSTSSKKRKMSK